MFSLTSTSMYEYSGSNNLLGMAKLGIEIDCQCSKSLSGVGGKQNTSMHFPDGVTVGVVGRIHHKTNVE
jgi:hypothetical protein